MDAEIKLLNNAEDVKLQLSNIFGPLTEGEQPIAQTLKSLSQKLSSLQEYHTGIDDCQEDIL